MTDITTQLNNTIGNNTAKNSAATAKSGTSSEDSKKLTGTTDQFLNILLAQLKYQDPTQPMKGTEFIDSISRLSSVEQTINTNKNLENITDILKSSNSQLGSPVSYLDKSIDYNTSQIALTKGITGFSYNLDTEKPPSKVTMVIKDAGGNVVVNTQATNNAGLNTVKWDGTDLSGNQLKDGLYTVSVYYPDPASKDPAKPTTIEVPTFTTGKVTGADFTGSDPMLKIGNISVPLTAVRTINSGSV